MSKVSTLRLVSKDRAPHLLDLNEEVRLALSEACRPWTPAVWPRRGRGFGSASGGLKTDQEGGGAAVGITYGSNPPTCPVRAWRAWVEAAGITEGPAFRNLRNGRVTGGRITGGGIARMVKRRAVAAGLTPELFSGHSLRSGFATMAARAGVAEHKIMRQGRWTTSQAMRGYIQEGELFVDNPSAKLGL
jgi:integrase